MIGTGSATPILCVSCIPIMFPAEQESVHIRHVKPEIKVSLLTMATRGEARALVQFLTLPCWLQVAT